VSTPAVPEYGPYTLYDLDVLPEDGKGYELADGWLTELPASPLARSRSRAAQGDPEGSGSTGRCQRVRRRRTE
jgi:hypothetical protein